VETGGSLPGSLQEEDTEACWRPMTTPPVNANDGIHRSSATGTGKRSRALDGSDANKTPAIALQAISRARRRLTRGRMAA
jgi:hypothetical protein